MTVRNERTRDSETLQTLSRHLPQDSYLLFGLRLFTTLNLRIRRLLGQLTNATNIEIIRQKPRPVFPAFLPPSSCHVPGMNGVSFEGTVLPAQFFSCLLFSLRILSTAAWPFLHIKVAIP